MKRFVCILLFLLPFVAGCWANVVTPQSPLKQSEVVVAKNNLGSCELSNGIKVSIYEAENKVAVILNGKSEVSNASFIESMSDQCMAAGFESLTCEQDAFTINQQICSGWKVTAETFIFTRQSVAQPSFELVRYERRSIDRRDPNKAAVHNVYSEKKLGQIRFANLNRDFLIKLINK